MKNTLITIIIIILVAILGGCSGSNSLKKESNSLVTDCTIETQTETAPETTTEYVTVYIPDDNEYVKVKDYIPSIFIELKYATADNFTGEVIYNFTDAYLRYGTVKKLLNAQTQANIHGYSIKIWDAYRPVEAQYKLWEVVPDPTYVAYPGKGPSGHNLGNCIDITLVNLDGSEIEMPTRFDDFTNLADRNYSDVSDTAACNASLLENIMYNNGFTGYYGEWWDYTDTDNYEYVDYKPQ